MLQEGGRMFILPNCNGLEEEFSVLFWQQPRWFPVVQTPGENCAEMGKSQLNFSINGILSKSPQSKEKSLLSFIFSKEMYLVR